MRSCTATGEKAIGTTGFLLFTAITLIVAILKLNVITDWSWWRVSLPIVIFVGFNMAYILVGFSYLSLVNIRERPPEDETAFLEDHHRIPHTSGSRWYCTRSSRTIWSDGGRAPIAPIGFGCCPGRLKRC